MKDLFQNKFMIVLIVIALLLVGTTSFMSALGYTSYVRNAIGIVLTPIQKAVDNAFDGVDNIFSSKKDFEALKKENENLKLELAKKEEESSKAMLALEENENLKKYLGIKDEHTDFVFSDALVTGRQSVNHTEIYTINKGSHHKIEPGMPVINEFGLIGCVTEVGLTWSKVSSIIEPKVSIGVIIERTGDMGISTGTFSSSEKGMCVLSYLPEKADIQVGDRIITSSDSSKYPKGLLLGTVDSISVDPISREYSAYIKPSVNLKEVEKVMIITEFENVYE